MDFILLLLCSLLLTARAAAGTAVLDSDGDALVRGMQYSVQSVFRPGGGLTLVTLNKTCPLFVAQAPFPDWSGRPVAFFPENQNDNTVQQGRTLNIMFPEPTSCPESTVWKVDRKTGYVATGGSMSSAVGPDSSRFAIRSVGNSHPDYQIEFCPCSIGVPRPSCRMGCLGTLGLVEGPSSNTLLGVNGNRPHTVNFVKVKQQQQEISSMIRSVATRSL